MKVERLMNEVLTLLLTMLVCASLCQMTREASRLKRGGERGAKRLKAKVQSEASEVTVDIYSGRRNPSWRINGKETEMVFQMLARLPPTPAVQFNEGLGYRGIWVRKLGTLSKFPYEMRVYRGIATDGARFYQDVDQHIESWLLRSGRRHLGAKTYALIRKDTGWTLSGRNSS